MAMDRYGPRVMIPMGIVIASRGLALAPLTSRPWHLHVTLGALVGGGSIFMPYIGHSLFLPHWFVRRRGLAIGIAFSGVGIGSIVLFPWLGRLIAPFGRRAPGWALLGLPLLLLLPPNTTPPPRRAPGARPPPPGRGGRGGGGAAGRPGLRLLLGAPPLAARAPVGGPALPEGHLAGGAGLRPPVRLRPPPRRDLPRPPLRNDLRHAESRRQRRR